MIYAGYLKIDRIKIYRKCFCYMELCYEVYFANVYNVISCQLKHIFHCCLFLSFIFIKLCLLINIITAYLKSNLLSLTLNIPSLACQRCLTSWGPQRTQRFFCNFSTVWFDRLLKLCFSGFWNFKSVVQALLVSNILCLFISTEVSQ